MELEQIFEKIRNIEGELKILKETVSKYILHHDANRTQTRQSTIKLFSTIAQSQITSKQQPPENPRRGTLPPTEKISQKTLDETLDNEDMNIPLRRPANFRVEKVETQ